MGLVFVGNIHVDKLDGLYRDAFGWDQTKLDAVHLAIGCYLCPRWPGRPSPAWATLIGPPSCGKSTILLMFDGFPFTVSVDHLTRNALTSCYSDEENPTEDHSFFHKLAVSNRPEGEKVWIIQELSSLMSADHITLEKQLADLRAAHVGKHSSHGGMGGTRVREIGSFGMVVGTTEAFELIRARMSTFGDRFLSIRMALENDTPEAIIADAETAWRANSSRMESAKRAIRDETHLILSRGIDHIKALANSDCSRSVEQERVLSAWSAIHSTFSTCPVSPTIMVTASGRPFRIVEQVKAWGNTHATICGRAEWTEAEMRIARRVFQDSMPRTNFDALSALWPSGLRQAFANADLYRQWSVLGAVETSDGRRIEYGRDNGAQLTTPYRRMIAESGYLQ